MKVVNEIDVYEVNGRPPGEERRFRIESHWNRSNMVVLDLGDEKIAVVAAQLERAIRNATNCG